MLNEGKKIGCIKQNIIIFLSFFRQLISIIMM